MKPSIGTLVETAPGHVRRVKFVTMVHPNGTFDILFTDGTWITFTERAKVLA